MIKKIFNSKAFFAFLLSLLLGSIIIIPNLIFGKGIFTLSGDFNFQQIPFNTMINKFIKTGNFFWTWQNELGSNFIGTFSFYNLFSPFNIITYIFPSSFFKYLVGPIYILKYAVAGLTSYLFLNRYVKNKNYAIIGSLLYAFSGFQLTNTLFYHFHDVVAFFPLILFTLDNYMYDNKKFGFSLAIALNAITNWFFFIGMVVFTVLYFAVKLIFKEYKINLMKFIHLVLESFCGVLIAAIVLIPSVLFTLNNPRIDNIWHLKDMFIYNDKRNYLEIFRSLILPNGTMNNHGIFNENNFASVELYLPVVSIVLAIEYILKQPKKWDSIFTLVLIVCMFVPVFNSSFFAFTKIFYARWYYMFSIILSLISIKTLDSNYKFNRSIGITLFLIALMFLTSLVIMRGQTIINNERIVIIFTIFCLLNIVFMSWVSKQTEHVFIKLLIAVFIYVGIWGNYCIYRYKFNCFKIDQTYSKYLNINNDISLDKFMRTNSDEFCNFNLGYLISTSNLKSWNSNINTSTFEFYKSIDYLDRGVATIINPAEKELHDFLSIETIISCGNNNLEKYGYKLNYSVNGYNLYLNPSANSMGFEVNSYILDKDYKKLNTTNKRKILKNTVVLTNSQLTKYGKYINPKKSYISNNYQFKDNGFESHIISSNDTFAVFTIPYDSGWKVFNNNKQITINNVDNGFIGIKINKGKNNIKFIYKTPGLRIGMFLSFLGVIEFLILLIFNNRWRVYEKE